MADRDNVETAAPVAATLDASWTISLGDYESQQRASQMWLRINARLPGQFQGMTHQVIDQQEGATLTAGPVLAADHAAALCDAVLEIGYSCDVLQPVSADSPFLAELDEPGVDVPDVVEPNTDVTEELTADNSNDVTVQPMPTEEIKTGMIEDGDSLDIDQVETPSSEVSEVDVTDQEAGQPAEDETTISSEPKVNPSDDDQQDRVILTMPVGVSSQDTVPTVLSSPLGVSDQPPVESVDVGPRREVRLPQGVPSVEKSSTDETVSSVVPGVAAMRRSAPNKDIDWGLDLGTYASEAEADLAWLRLRAREQTLLAGFNRRTEDGGSGTKLIAGAVPSRAQADEICKAIVPNRSGCVPYKF